MYRNVSNASVKNSILTNYKEPAALLTVLIFSAVCVLYTNASLSNFFACTVLTYLSTCNERAFVGSVYDTDTKVIT